MWLYPGRVLVGGSRGVRGKQFKSRLVVCDAARHRRVPQLNFRQADHGLPCEGVTWQYGQKLHLIALQ